jgi:hypothetical protein
VQYYFLACCEYEKHKNKNKVQINYLLNYDNYKEYIFNFLHNKGYSIDVYFCTNNSSDIIEKKIIETYQPIKYLFIKNERNKEISRNKKLIKVIELCINNNINYDIVLITRFNLLFKKSFEESNIKLDKFNLVSILERDNLVCDNFYLFPFSKLNKFYEISKNNFNKSFHKIKDEIENIENKEFVNYILSENKKIAKLSFYEIVRNYI